MVIADDGGFVLAGDYARMGDIFVIKSDREGEVEWNLILGGNGTERCEEIIHAIDGGYILLGDWDRQGAEDAYVTKISDEGEVEWDQNMVRI